jgi:hypothetical protein
MAGQAGGGRRRPDVLVGTAVVMALMMALMLLGNGHMGHTRTMNYDLKPPQIVPAAPAWLRDSRD